MKSINDQMVKRYVEALCAETERWCWRAIAAGVGNRVWRSESRISLILGQQTITHDFAILAPGDPIPGSGIVFGPFAR